MTVEELEAERRKLVEQLGVYMEKEDQMPPVAARIVATLILTCKQGTTFDQLVHDLEASKSTVSAHLNTLTSNGLINYITRPGDRKRYFIMTPNRLIQFIEEKLAKWETDMAIHKKLIDFKTNANEVYKDQPEKQCELKFHHNFLTFLEEATEVFTKLKTNLIEKNQ